VTVHQWEGRRSVWAATPEMITRARFLVVEQGVPLRVVAPLVRVARSTIWNWWRKYEWPGRPARKQRDRHVLKKFTVPPPEQGNGNGNGHNARRRRCEECGRVVPWDPACPHCGAVWLRIRAPVSAPTRAAPAPGWW
jgi:hypothetical protein